MGRMSQQDMDAVMAAHFAAESAHDLEGILATLTEDAIHQIVGIPDGLLQGHEAIRQRYAQNFADFEPGEAEPVYRNYGDDYLIDECIWRTRAIGQPLGIPGNGRSVVMRILHVCEFRDGRIAKELVWMDAAGLIAQLNAPAP